MLIIETIVSCHEGKAFFWKEGTPSFLDHPMLHGKFSPHSYAHVDRTARLSAFHWYAVRRQQGVCSMYIVHIFPYPVPILLWLLNCNLDPQLQLQSPLCRVQVRSVLVSYVVVFDSGFLRLSQKTTIKNPDHLEIQSEFSFYFLCFIR